MGTAAAEDLGIFRDGAPTAHAARGLAGDRFAVTGSFEGVVLVGRFVARVARLLFIGLGRFRLGVPVRVEAERERLLSVKRGDVSWANVDAWRKDLHREFEVAAGGDPGCQSGRTMKPPTGSCSRRAIP